MNKKILLLGLSIIIAGSNAMAECSKNGCPIKSTITVSDSQCTKSEPQQICPAKKSLCPKGSELNAPHEAMRYKQYMEQIQQERATVYNALNLTDEQIQERENILMHNNAIYEQKFDELIKESFKLKALKSACACNKEILNQRKIVRDIKKSIEKTLICENKDFKKSLTREQRSKYAMIKKLERRDFKRAAHQKNYYKSNPQMRSFGNPTRPSCPIGKTGY